MKGSPTRLDAARQEPAPGSSSRRTEEGSTRKVDVVQARARLARLARASNAEAYLDVPWRQGSRAHPRSQSRRTSILEGLICAHCGFSTSRAERGRGERDGHERNVQERPERATAGHALVRDVKLRLTESGSAAAAADITCCHELQGGSRWLSLLFMARSMPGYAFLSRNHFLVTARHILALANPSGPTQLSDEAIRTVNHPHQGETIIVA